MNRTGVFRVISPRLSYTLLGILWSAFAVAQTGTLTLHESVYDSLKRNGALAPGVHYELLPGTNQASAKTGFTPPGPDFQIAIPASDDGSSSEITLPFSFCFFGDPVNSVYINTNGNLSFGSPFSTSTALPLPQNTFQFIAPFWADVDTRAGGTVWYRLTNTALYVVWEDVGYFDQNTDKQNTFQVVLTDGVDPALPFGYNVGMFYRDMEWTTGDGSGGTNGLGGAPATVGLNRGNGTDFIQIGRFNDATANYDGPFGSNDGVAWLENRNMYLKTCSSGNIAPVVTGIELSDTIRVCLDDTVNYEVLFLAPESGQNVAATAVNTSLPGFSLLSATSGATASATFRVTGSIADQGFHTVFSSGTDNGTPALSTSFPMVFQLDSLNPPPSITGTLEACTGDSTNLLVAGTYDRYLWSTGSDSQGVRVPSGNYRVTVSEGLCRTSIPVTVADKTPSPSIQGPAYVCLPDTFTLRVLTTYDSYAWNTSPIDTQDSIRVDSAVVYTVTVENDGCFGSNSFQVSHLGVDPYSLSASDTNSCNGDSVDLNALPGFDSYLWNTTQTTQTIRVDSGTYWVEVSLNAGAPGVVCRDTDTVVIDLVTYPPLSITRDSIFCNGGSTTITVDSTYQSYLWSTGATTQSITVTNSGTYRVTVSVESCQQDTGVVVTENAVVNANINGRRYYCPGGDSANIFVAPVWDSVLWSTGAMTDTIRVLPGTYSATVWINGCSDVGSFTVDTLRSGFPILGDTSYCPGSTTRLDGGFGLDTYAWSHGPATRFVDVDQGTYVVTVTLDTCAAVSDSAVVVELPAVAPVITGDTLICSGGSGVLSVAFGYDQYQWSTGSSALLTPIDSAGTYWIEVQDSNGCLLTDTVVVQDLPVPVPVILGDTFFCDLDSTVLSVNSFARVQWSTGSNDTSVTVGTGSYSITVIDTNGCSGSAGPVSVVQSIPVASILGDSSACVNGLSTLYTLFTDTLSWSTGDTLDTIRVGPGTYTLTVTDVYGCRDTASFTVTARTQPQAAFSSDPAGATSSDSPVQFTDQSTISSGQLVSWNWDFGDNAGTSGSQNPQYTYTMDGNYRILLEVTSDSGCTDTASVLLEVFSDVRPINVITPNGDNINDFLVFPNLSRYSGSTLYIYNRWGELIYEDSNYRNNWDGRFMTAGTYFYVLEVPDTGTTLKGTFTLLK